MVYIFTYITLNKINGKLYFGVHKTSNLEDGYLGSGTRLRCAIKKYGRENFEVIDRVFYDNYEAALEAECEFVNEDIVADPMWYNLKTGGKFVGIKYSDESKQKLSKSKKLCAENRTEDEIVRFKESCKQRWAGMSAESKELHRIKSQSWNNKSEEEKCSINDKRRNAWYNKSEEEKCSINDKRRNTLLNKTDEQKESARQRQRGWYHRLSDEERADIRCRTSKCINERTEEEKESINQKRRDTLTSRSDEEKAIHGKQISEALAGVPKELVTCPHCSKCGGIGAMMRWHFENCKWRS